MKKTLAFIVSLGVIAGAITDARAQRGAQRGEWKTVRRRSRPHEILPAGPDQQRERQEPAHRVAMAVGR